MEQDARGIAEAWSRVVAHLGIAIDAERPLSAAAHRVPGKINLVERVHDGPLQEAIALQMRVRGNPDLAEIDHALSGLVASLRGVIAGDAPRRDATLEAQLAAAARRCHWAHVELVCQVPQGLSDQIADLVLRVVQESLANLRHADARIARVTVREGHGELRVTVEDDGTGFDPRAASTPRPGHLGLPWLRDAVASSGGELHVRSALGLGSCITASLPLACGSARSERLTDSLTA